MGSRRSKIRKDNQNLFLKEMERQRQKEKKAKLAAENVKR
jgi:hypothetical protein